MIKFKYAVCFYALISVLSTAAAASSRPPVAGDYEDINSDPMLGNPLHLPIFAPDPSAHVWPDGRLYLYPSRDTPGQKNYYGMESWYVLSTDNLVDWTNHGKIFHVDDIPWAEYKAWAPDCAYKDGTYYFYFPCQDTNSPSQNWIGVATSDSPAGPFTHPAKVRRGVDPNVFEDYDGNYWLAINHSIERLSDDMLSVVPKTGVVWKDYAIGFPDYEGWQHEGTWIFKRNGIYYLMTAGKTPQPMPKGIGGGMPVLYYGMSKSPTGPFEYKGILMDVVGNPYNPTNLGNNHGSIVEFKGKWILFYHKQWEAPDGNIHRATCADYITFNPDGTMNEVIPTDKGVDLR